MISCKKRKKVENEGNAHVFDWTRAETEKLKMTEGMDDYEGNDRQNERQRTGRRKQKRRRFDSGTRQRTSLELYCGRLTAGRGSSVVLRHCYPPYSMSGPTIAFHVVLANLASIWRRHRVVSENT